MSKKKIFLSAGFIILLAGAWYGYKEYNRGVEDLANVKAAATFTTAELISSFEADEKKANASWLDKIIAVEGVIKSVDKNDFGRYTVVLGEDGNMSAVRCAMDSAHNNEASSLKAGALVVMKGACTGFQSDELLGSDVILNRCVVEKK